MNDSNSFEQFAGRLGEFIRLSMRGMATEFNRLALELFALQFRNNPPYQRFCQARRVLPGSVSHWSAIPAMPTSGFKELELTSLPADEWTVIFHSSGTTEQKPSQHYHGARSLPIYEASGLAWFEAAFQPPEGPKRWAILTPSAAQAPRSSLVHMFDAIRLVAQAPASAFLGKLDAAGAWTLDWETAVGTLREARDAGQPLVILGTAFSYVHLLDFLTERGIRFVLPPGSRAMETGGYKGRSRSLPKTELHALMTERLGLSPDNIVCEYGMSELSSQAYDTPLRGEDGPRRFRFPPWARVRIISPETGEEVLEGETGLIQVFDLANVYSVMAIQTEDLGLRRGNEFELIGRAALAEARGCSLQAP